jgi:hypothetical protein
MQRQEARADVESLSTPGSCATRTVRMKSLVKVRVIKAIFSLFILYINSRIYLKVVAEEL